MKNLLKLSLVLLAFVIGGQAYAMARAYNAEANKQLLDLLRSRVVPTHEFSANKWSFEDGQTIKSLIEQGADPNVNDGETTPIFAAIYSGNPDAVEAVVNAGADLTQVEPLYETTPLQYAKSPGFDQYRPRNPRIVQFLESVLVEKSKL